MRKFRSNIWPYIAVLITGLSWLAINSDKVIDNYNSFTKWYGSSKSLEGIWSNSFEGDIDPPEWLTNQPDSMEVRLSIDKSLVDGTIITGRLRKLVPWEYILLEGKKHPFQNTLDVDAYDYIDGKKVLFGRLSISIDDNKLIIDNLDKDETSFFPKTTYLVKVSEVAFPELANKKNSKDDEDPPILIPKPDGIDSQQKHK